MTDDGRPQPPAPASPGTASWGDGANWLNLLTGTTGTAPAADEDACFQDEACCQGQPGDTTGGAGW